ncbi:MAG: phosphoribosylanthranilate isomerase [Gammaproteobacteria bacterium]|nr:phosphoribosylanthranilate isomerase [Gammaproteobacteria bacterium]
MVSRVKICGITTLEDALFVADCGADAIGLVFYGPSPRAVSVDQAATITAALPPFVTTVALFVNADPVQVEEVVDLVRIDQLQFHGDESPEYCAQFSRPWMKAIRMRPEVDLLVEAERFAASSALLVDAYQSGIPGGTGARFDWSRIPSTLHKPLVLAGGLSVENVAEGIEQLQPWAVDVSGGVEEAKGVKSHEKIIRFIEKVKQTQF